MRYTVKQLAGIAGVSARTLRFYDQCGLLKPASYGENRYRYYGEAEVLRLQQIRFYRELDLSLDAIRAILDRPDFDVAGALRAHRRALGARAGRLQTLIRTIDHTLDYMEGTRIMGAHDLFAGFDEATQRRYEAEAAQRWGTERVTASRQRWDSYTKEQQAAIFAEGEGIYRAIIARIADDPASAAVQEAIGRWHQHLRHFYEPTPETLLGLGRGYEGDPAFAAFLGKMHPDLPGFLRRAIEHYCRDLAASA